MFGALFALAVAVGILSALAGSRTALALLVGTGLQLLLAVVDVPFFAPLWMLIDLAVAAAIVRMGMTRSGALVIALFIPAWVFYFIDGDLGYDGSVTVCSAQMLLTVPLARIWRRAKATRLPPDPFDLFDLRVAA